MEPLKNDFKDVENVRKLLKEFDDGKFEKYYDYDDDITTCAINSVEDVNKLIKDNHPLVFSFNDENEMYVSIDGENELELFNVEISSNFIKSDEWLSADNRIIEANIVFPSIVRSDISVEKTSFFICLVIATCMRSDYLDEFEAIIKDYDFKSFEGEVFTKLKGNWIEAGSKVIRMLASAAKYSILRNAKKKTTNLFADVQQEKVFVLDELESAIDAIRFEYDRKRLSPDKRALMTKLEIKNVIAERDSEIEKLYKKNDYKGVIELYKIKRINSENVNPFIKQKIRLHVNRRMMDVYFDIYNVQTAPKEDIEKENFSKLRKYFYKEMIRAVVNEMKIAQKQKFMLNPDSYVAPNFV